MQNFDGLFILSHKHKIIPQKFTDAFLNAISTLSENIKFFDQEMVRSGNDRIYLPSCNVPYFFRAVEVAGSGRY